MSRRDRERVGGLVVGFSERACRRKEGSRDSVNGPDRRVVDRKTHNLNFFFVNLRNVKETYFLKFIIPQVLKDALVLTNTLLLRVDYFPIKN